MESRINKSSKANMYWLTTLKYIAEHKSCPGALNSLDQSICKEMNIINRLLLNAAIYYLSPLSPVNTQWTLNGFVSCVASILWATHP